jgi:hypothetical protein
MLLYSVSGIVADVPDAVERGIQQIAEYLRPAIAFVGKMAGEHPNEFVIALSAVATAIFTFVLAMRTAGLFKETAGLREETAVLAKFAEQQAGDMKDSIAAAQTAADAATKSADVAEKTLIATQRSWVSVHDLKIVARLYFAQGGAHLPLEFELKNTGNSPALFVHIEARMFPLHKETIDIVAMQKQVREKAQAQEWRKHESGMAIFPGDVRPEKKIVSVSKEELEKGSFERSDGLRGVNLVLVGCVDYEFSFEQGHHQTGFVYAVLTPGASLQLQEVGGVDGISLARLPGGETAN